MMAISAEEFEALARVISESQAAKSTTVTEEEPPAVAPEVAAAPTAADPTPQPAAGGAPRSKKRATDGIAQLILDNGEPRKPLSILANGITIFRGYDPRWLGVLAFDEFSRCITTQKPAPWQNSAGGNWESDDDIRAADYLQHHGIYVSPKVAGQAIQVAAADNPFHPVRDYLRSLRWDSMPRLDNWLAAYLGAEPSEWIRACGPRWLLSAVARVMRPGCQADHTLLLRGAQGIRKSSALRILASDPWFTDHISALGSKDSRLELNGKLIVEMAELDGIKSNKLEQVKAFLTARFDQFRPPYGTRVLSSPRQCVFAASTNDATSLADETGGRRFWPVHCGIIELDGLRRDRDQLWAEAFTRYQAGEAWWLDRRDLNQLASEEQDKIYTVGVWDETILDWCAAPRLDPMGMNTVLLSKPGQVLLTEVIVHGLNIPLNSSNVKATQSEVVRCLVHAGWTRKQFRIPGLTARKWFYVNPAEG